MSKLNLHELIYASSNAATMAAPDATTMTALTLSNERRDTDQGDTEDESHHGTTLNPSDEKENEYASEDDYDFDEIDQTLPSMPSSWTHSAWQTLQRLYTVSPAPLDLPVQFAPPQPIQRPSLTPGRKRCVEWDQVRARWKRRRFDYRPSATTDIGHAMQSWLATCRRHETHESNNVHDMAPAGTAVAHETAVAVSDRMPQEQGMDEAWTLSSLPPPAQASASTALDVWPCSYATTLGPWDYGKFTLPKQAPLDCTDAVRPVMTVSSAVLPTVPVWHSLRRRFTTVRDTDPISTNDISTTTTEACVVTVSTWATAHCRSDRSTQLLRDSTVAAAPSLLYPRMAFRAVARHVMGNVQDDMALRCVSILWRTSSHIFTTAGATATASRPWSRTAVSNDQARRRGHAMWTWHQWTWRHAAATARLLGVLAMDGPNMGGVSRTPGTDFRFGYQLHKLVQTYALEPVVYDASSSRTPNARRHGTPPGSTLVAPATLYAHVPGTVPPTPPMGPLTVTALIWGPTDRYEHVVSHGPGGIDDSVVALTLASLVRRTAGVMEPTRGRVVHAATLRQIGAVLQHAVMHNQHLRYKRIQRQVRQSDLELPLAFFHRAMAEYASYLLNGVPCTVETADKDLVTFNGQCDTEDSSNVSNLVAVVEHLLEFLDDHIDHNGLQMFTDLHVNWGLLHIAKMLPDECVELLSQPMDRHCRTPLEKMAHILRHLEESRCLVESQPSSADKSIINVGELEFALHRAATMFARCVERSPTDATCHLWHTAMLASSLLLCSGNRIGSAAVTIPSPLTRGRTRRFTVESNTTPRGDWHVRRMLPKFSELRRDTAQAFHLLLHLAKFQQGARASLAVASFLEWRQVIALLVGPSDTNAFDSVCQLHRHYSKHWALEEQSEQSLQCLQACDNLDDRLDGLARALEMNPADVEHWRSLVDALGPIGSVVSDQDATACLDAQCPSCSRLSHDRNIDHVTWNARSHGGWWGAERAWWYQNFLQVECVKWTNVGSNQVKGNDVDTLVMALLGALEEAQPFTPTSVTLGQAIDHVEHTLWLEELLHSPVGLAKDGRLDDVDSAVVDDLLPATFLERCDQSRERNESSHRLTLLGKDSALWELWIYKLLVLCHWSSPLHRDVDMAVERLVNNVWDETNGKLLTDRDSFRCLFWLYQMGLDVVLVFLQARKQRREDR